MHIMRKLLLLALLLPFYACEKDKTEKPKIQYTDNNDYILRIECSGCELNLLTPQQIKETITEAKGYRFFFNSDPKVGYINGTIKNPKKQPVVVYAWAGATGDDGSTKLYNSEKIQSSEEDITIAIGFKKQIF